MKRIICSAFANGSEIITRDDLINARNELDNVIDTVGTSSYLESIRDQLDEELAYGDATEYHRYDFSGAVNQFLNFYLTGEDPLGSFTVDEDDSFRMYNGNMCVSSITDPFGESAGNSRYFKDGEEGKAIEYWFQESQKYPECTSIDGLRYQGDNIHKWTLNHASRIRTWDKMYNCPYDIEFILDACKRPCKQSDKYPDQIHPYSLG